jgi:hypothetical protein
MGHAIPVRTDYTAGEVRRFAQRAKDAAQASYRIQARVIEADSPSVVYGGADMPLTGPIPEGGTPFVPIAEHFIR